MVTRPLEGKRPIMRMPETIIAVPAKTRAPDARPARRPSMPMPPPTALASAPRKAYVRMRGVVAQVRAQRIGPVQRKAESQHDGPAHLHAVQTADQAQREHEA